MMWPSAEGARPGARSTLRRALRVSATAHGMRATSSSTDSRSPDDHVARVSLAVKARIDCDAGPALPRVRSRRRRRRRSSSFAGRASGSPGSGRRVRRWEHRQDAASALIQLDRRRRPLAADAAARPGVRSPRRRRRGRCARESPHAGRQRSDFRFERVGPTLAELKPSFDAHRARIEHVPIADRRLVGFAGRFADIEAPRRIGGSAVGCVEAWQPELVVHESADLAAPIAAAAAGVPTRQPRFRPADTRGGVAAGRRGGSLRSGAPPVSSRMRSPAPTAVLTSTSARRRSVPTCRRRRRARIRCARPRPSAATEHVVSARSSTRPLGTSFNDLASFRLLLDAFDRARLRRDHDDRSQPVAGRSRPGAGERDRRPVHPSGRDPRRLRRRRRARRLRLGVRGARPRPAVSSCFLAAPTSSRTPPSAQTSASRRPSCRPISPSARFATLWNACSATLPIPTRLARSAAEIAAMPSAAAVADELAPLSGGRSGARAAARSSPPPRSRPGGRAGRVTRRSTRAG